MIVDDLLNNYPKPTLKYRQAIGLASMNGSAEEVDEARRDFLAVVIENALARNAAKLPLPLTKEQKKAIIELLNYDPTKAG